MEDLQTEVVYIASLARILGKTESSIREGLRRQVPWLPPSFKLAGQHAWLKEDVLSFLRGLSDSNPAPARIDTKRKPGRKRRVPPVFQA